MLKRSVKASVISPAAALLALVAWSPRRITAPTFASSRIAPGDLAPQKAQAIVDIGLASVSVLVTWSKRLRY